MEEETEELKRKLEIENKGCLTKISYIEVKIKAKM